MNKANGTWTLPAALALLAILFAVQVSTDYWELRIELVAAQDGALCDSAVPTLESTGE